MFDHERRQMNVGTHYTDTRLRTVAGQARTYIFSRKGRRNEDGPEPDQGNPIFLDCQLLGVGAGFNEDLIPARSCINRVLNELAGLNVYGAAAVPDCRC